MKTRHYVALDGMRGVAAFAVVIYHIATVPYIRAPSGYLAVDFFFALSGFVIAHAYRERLIGGMPLKDFAILRVARLYPILFLGFLLASLRGLSLLMIQNPNAPPMEEIIFGSTLNLLLLPMPLVGTYMFLNVPAWSLMFEIIANFAYARWVRQINRAVLATVVIVSGALLIPIAAAGLFKAGASIETFHIGLLRVSFSFAIGLLLHSFSDRLPSWTINPYLLVIGLFASLVAPVWHPLYDLFFVAVLSPAFLVLGANSRPFAGAKWLGEISYPVYAVHYSLISIGSFAAGKFGAPPWIFMLGIVLIMCLANGLITNLYDIPNRHRLRRLLTYLSLRFARSRNADASTT